MGNILLKVLDEETLAPLSGARVTVGSTYLSVTSVTGEVVGFVPAGVHFVTITKSGYHQFSLPQITVTAQLSPTQLFTNLITADSVTPPPPPPPPPVELKDELFYLYFEDSITGVAIQGVTAAEGSNIQTSTAGGLVAFQPPAGEHIIQVNKTGYQGVTVTIITERVPLDAPATMETVFLTPLSSPPPEPEPEPAPPDNYEQVPPSSISWWDKLKALITGGAILTPATFASSADLVKNIKSGAPSSPAASSFLGKYGGKLGGGVLSGLSSITYNATFGDFILEEAMQGALFPISILIREKEYALAQTQLDAAVQIWKLAVEYRHTAGLYNWMTGEAFEANVQAVGTQIIAYQEILKKYRVAIPDIQGDFTALARTIVDGDTLKCKIGPNTVTVRVIGINTPESGEPYYSDSKRALFRFCWGQNVTVKVDPANIFDAFGRVLGVVYVGTTNINLSMVRQGWAFYYPYTETPLINDAEFRAADRLAQTEKRGIWGLVNRANLAAPEGAIPVKANRTAIKITSIPAHAQITLDGEYTYKQTAETIDVTPGPHSVQLDEYGYMSEVKLVDVPDGVTVEVHFKLIKL